jgi:undecaprenyl-diphosphatase
MLDRLIAFDTRFFLWLNSWHSPFWDRVMWSISGRTEWIPFYLLLIVYLIYYYRRQSIYIIIGAVLAVTLADQLAVHALKDVIGRLRPSQNPNIQDLVHIVNNYRGGLYGFVSNHAANTFSIATFLGLVVRKRYFSWVLYVWATLVSYSRIYLGVHYPGDVAAGALLGILIGWLLYIGYKYITSRNHHTQT